MCPDSDRPNRGLFHQERTACAGSDVPQFTIDAGSGSLVAANAAGWRAWGCEPLNLEPLNLPSPVVLDAAMPALKRLRELLHGGVDVRRNAETLTFWTARGLLVLRCALETDPAEGARVHVKALEVPAMQRGAQRGAMDLAHGQPRGGADPLSVALDAWLAHELRTPLSAIIAYAEILKDEHFGPLASARYKGYARDIYESARHGLGVVDSLLRGDPTPSLVPPLAVAELEPTRVVESCLTVVRPLAERAGLVLSTEFSPDLPRVVADELSLKQMLLNLLANAIKFARVGDRVTIAVARGGAGLDICVADTGPGMAANGAVAPWANPAARLRGDGAGLGLGLPLTRALAAANGAALSIESAPGEGTRATIAFGQDRIVHARSP
jgi:two-component system, cell cycle sensor histidine kinase PleC